MPPPIPLIALHGFTGDAEDFAWLAAHSSHHWDWRSLDLPGHGACAPGNVSLDACLRLIEHARTSAYEATGQCPLLLGYSMGGRVALHAASREPDAWRGLVLIGATPGLSDKKERRARAEADHALAAHLANLSIDDFLAQWQRHPIIASQENIPPDILTPLRERRRRHHPERLAAALRALSPGILPALWERLPALDLPTLLIAGEQDAKFAGIAREMAARLPHAQVTLLPDVGHCAHLEAPTAFLQALSDWAAPQG